jgi:hypothetical protein
LCFLISKAIKAKSARVIAITVISLTIPVILAANNWDDHDRSDKYTAQAMAHKYLDSCAENAILFTIGDNDTFALWYAQEIEGYRTDVRVVNTSLFQTDWYIDQMKRKAYESDPVPSQYTHDQYKYGTRDHVIGETITKDTMLIKDFLNWIGSDNPKTKLKYLLQQSDQDIDYYPNQYLNSNYFPTENVRIPVNKETVLKNGLVKPEDADEIVPYIDIQIKNSAIYKNRLLMLDIVANNDWKRPIYFTGGAFAEDDYIWMKDYLQLDGMCYKLVPIHTPVDKANPFDMGRVDADLMYEKVKKWNWGNSEGDIYHDPETRKNAITYRGNLARLVEKFINEDQPKKAEEIADLAIEKMPVQKFGYYTLLEPYISAYYEVGSDEKGRKLYKEVVVKYQENLKYYSELDKDKQYDLAEDIITDIERYRSLVGIVALYDEEIASEEMEAFRNHLRLFRHFYDSEDEDDLNAATEDADVPNQDSIKAIIDSLKLEE